MEDIYDDLKELMDDQEDIQEIMGRSYGVDFDEAELEDELNELDEEIINEQLTGVPSYVPAAASKSEAVPMMNV